MVEESKPTTHVFKEVAGVKVELDVYLPDKPTDQPLPVLLCVSSGPPPQSS